MSGVGEVWVREEAMSESSTRTWRDLCRSACTKLVLIISIAMLACVHLLSHVQPTQWAGTDLSDPLRSFFQLSRGAIVVGIIGNSEKANFLELGGWSSKTQDSCLVLAREIEAQVLGTLKGAHLAKLRLWWFELPITFALVASWQLSRSPAASANTADTTFVGLVGTVCPECGKQSGGK